MNKFIYQFKVRPEHIDDYGHVNNAKYLELFEEARWAILEEKKLGHSMVREHGIGPVILEVNVKFRFEITEGQEITIETRSENVGDRIFYFYQTMKDNSGKICSEAIFKSALFNLKERKMIKADQEWKEAFGF